jgi:hypothetical protein
MVKWFRDGDQWSWDFSNMEKFIKLHRKIAGKPILIEASCLRANWRLGSAISVKFIDKKTGKLDFISMKGDEPKTCEIAVNFVKALRQSLAGLKLEDKLALGIWTDKDGIRMHKSNWGDPILKALIENMPDLKLSGWSHGNSIQVKNENIALVINKFGNTSKKYPYYLLKSMMYPRQMSALTYKNIGIPRILWGNALGSRKGAGLTTLASWSHRQIRKHGTYSYKGHYAFSTELNLMVYPLFNNEAVTNGRYEIFREVCQNFELLKIMKKKGIEAPVMTGLFSWLRETGSGVRKDHPLTHEYYKSWDNKHWEILEAAGKAGIK